MFLTFEVVILSFWRVYNYVSSTRVDYRFEDNAFLVSCYYVIFNQLNVRSNCIRSSLNMLFVFRRNNNYSDVVVYTSAPFSKSGLNFLTA